MMLGHGVMDRDTDCNREAMSVFINKNFKWRDYTIACSEAHRSWSTLGQFLKIGKVWSKFPLNSLRLLITIPGHDDISVFNFNFALFQK